MSRARLLAGVALVVAAVLALALLLDRGEADHERGLTVAQTGAVLGAQGALGWDPERRRELEERAATGTSHVIYALSPGGVLASAQRTERWRPQVERAAAAHDVDPDRLEAMVFLESAGRAEVMAGETPEAASGLAQIIPSAATELLGMRVDLPRSIALSRKLEKAAADGRDADVRRLSRERARVDERFDPKLALDGAARYLRIATDRFGSSDLATVSYHMGIGNLESVVRAYAQDEQNAPVGDVVAAQDLSYPQLFFDSAPDRNAQAHEILSGFADDSSLYLWRVLASERIMERWRSDRQGLEHTVELATAKASLEELYHPEETAEVFEEPGDVEDALADGKLLPLPDGRELGWVADERMGELAGELDQEPELYRALRPEALATLSYMAASVRELSGARRPLRVMSAVRDASYQDLLAAENQEATQAYSLHTTGYSFDVRRDYESDAQAAAFQFVLDRLRAHAVIDYAVEPSAIHVTVSTLGAELVAP